MLGIIMFHESSKIGQSFTKKLYIFHFPIDVFYPSIYSDIIGNFVSFTDPLNYTNYKYFRVFRCFYMYKLQIKINIFLSFYIS